jgi:hypothetical protein
MLQGFLPPSTIMMENSSENVIVNVLENQARHKIDEYSEIQAFRQDLKLT